MREGVTVDEAEGSDEDDSGQPVATRPNLGWLLGDFTTFLLLLGRANEARRIARSFAGLSLLVAIFFGSLSPLSLADFSTAFFSATTRHCLQCTHAQTFYVLSSTSFFLRAGGRVYRHVGATKPKKVYKRLSIMNLEVNHG